MGLFEPAWMKKTGCSGKEVQQAEKAFAKMSDKELAECALKIKDQYVVSKAVERIRSDKELVVVAEKIDFTPVKTAVANRLMKFSRSWACYAKLLYSCDRLVSGCAMTALTGAGDSLAEFLLGDGFGLEEYIGKSAAEREIHKQAAMKVVEHIVEAKAYGTVIDNFRQQEKSNQGIGLGDIATWACEERGKKFTNTMAVCPDCGGEIVFETVVERVPVGEQLRDREFDSFSCEKCDKKWDVDGLEARFERVDDRVYVSEDKFVMVCPVCRKLLVRKERAKVGSDTKCKCVVSEDIYPERVPVRWVRK